ncbi:MAG TPA: NUDIX hydrolase [Planctomycetes bacterium]|nr:NUDIX hydrolase [Planctomycetota bacterium]
MTGSSRIPPGPKLRELRVLQDLAEQRGPKEGFLQLSRLLIQNCYEDGSLSRPYPCDLVSRRGTDAVTIALYQPQPDGRVQIGLRANLRPPVWLRRHKATLLFPDEEPCDLCYETVAGILEAADQGAGLEAALRRRAQAECLEEVGLNLPLDAFEELGPPSFPSPGITDEKVYFLAAQVDFTQAVPPKGDGSVMEEVGGLVLLDLQDFLESPSPTDMKTDLALRRLAARL